MKGFTGGVAGRRRVWALLALALLLAPLVTPVHSAQEAVARLTDFTGVVVLRSRGDWGVKPEKGLALYSMDKVVTRIGTAIVTFHDGALIEIKANSNLLIEEQEKTGSVTRSLRLLLGKMLFTTGKESKTQTILQTPTAVAGLRGTAGTLRVGLDGQAHLQFIEGGASYTVGNFISGLAEDVPQELADLNPAQRAAFAAAAAAELAKKAAEDLLLGKISDPQAALAAARAAEAAALEAKAAAEAMLRNADPAIVKAAQAAIEAAHKALEEARKAQEEAIKRGAKVGEAETYTPAQVQVVLNLVPTTTLVVEISTTAPLTTTSIAPSTTTIPPVTTSAPALTTSVAPSTTTITPVTTSAPAPTTSVAPSTTTITPVTTSAPAPTTSVAPLANNSVPGFLSTATLEGAFGGNANEWEISFTGQAVPPLQTPAAGSIGGTMTDGTFEGFLAGVAGSWSGLFTSIYVKDDRSAGFLTGSLTGTAVNGSLVAGGHVVRSPVLGTAAIDPQDLMSVMSNPGTEANLYLKGTGSVPGTYVPILGEVDIRSNRSALWGAAGAPKEIGGISLSSPSGRILGVWAHAYPEGGFFANAGAPLAWSNITWGYAGHGRHDTYMMGNNITFTDDGIGHARISGEVDYLDERFTGKVTLTYQGTYSSNENSNGYRDYQTVGAGTILLDPLQFSLVSTGSLLRNLDGQPQTAGDFRGIMGSTSLPFAGLAGFVTMGQYREDLASGAYLFTSSITGGELANGSLQGSVEGFTAGLWNRDKFSGDPWGNRNADGSLWAVYVRPNGEAGLLKGTISGNRLPLSSNDGMWTAQVGLEPRPMVTGLGGSISVMTSPGMGGTLTGSFHDGAGSSAGSISSAITSSESKVLKVNDNPLDWGVYRMTLGTPSPLEKNFEKPESYTQWSASVAGSGYFGPLNHVPWEALIDGTWSPQGEIRGTPSAQGVSQGLDGIYYQSDGVTVAGTIEGVFYGVNMVAPSYPLGYWIGQSAGIWGPSELDGWARLGSLYAHKGGLILKVGEDPARIALGKIQEGGYRFLAIGDYSLEEGRPSTILQDTRITGADREGAGGLDGYLASVWKAGGIEGSVLAIHVASDGSTGLLAGDVSGGYYAGLEKWKAKGTLSLLPLSSGTVPAWTEVVETPWTPAGGGAFSGGGAIHVAAAQGSTLSIPGENWGVWQTLHGGSYTGTPQDTWALSLSSQAQGGNRWVQVEGSKWSAEKLTARAAGAWVNWNDAVTGVMGGSLKGTFNPADATWQAVGLGANLETGQFLDMISKGRADALQKLNIPCVEVGRTTLAGTSSLLKVRMNDVTFFAYSTGANPRIWATSNVSGSYSGIPSAGHTVNLQSTSGGNLNANFSVNNWANSRWGAAVAGAGTLNRTDVPGSTSLQFSGAAAGTYGSGAFSGTGSGVASPR